MERGRDATGYIRLEKTAAQRKPSTPVSCYESRQLQNAVFSAFSMYWKYNGSRPLSLQLCQPLLQIEKATPLTSTAAARQTPAPVD
jgi:hypothetical protein